MGVNAVLYYGPTIFEEAGLSGGDALFSQVLVGVVNAVTTVIAVFIIDKVGRKKLVYYGVSGMILSLLLIGFYFSFAETLNLPNNFLLFFFLFIRCGVSLLWRGMPRTNWAVIWHLVSVFMWRCR